MSTQGQAEESEYAASRYTPAMKGVLEDLVMNSLSFDQYPSVLPMPDAVPKVGSSTSGGGKRGGTAGVVASVRGAASSARKTGGTTSRWAKTSGGGSAGGGGATGPQKLSGARSLIFIVGGCSYPELKVARDVMQKQSREIIVGSTAFINPTEFVADLEILGQDQD
jgi:syntaxin-binding protein 1